MLHRKFQLYRFSILFYPFDCLRNSQIQDFHACMTAPTHELFYRSLLMRQAAEQKQQVLSLLSVGSREHCTGTTIKSIQSSKLRGALGARARCSLRQALPHSAKPVRSMFISVRYGPLRSIPRRPFPSFPRFLSSYESAFSVRGRSRSRAWTHSPPAAPAQKPPSRPAPSGSPPARPAAR